MAFWIHYWTTLKTKICRGKISCELEKPVEEFSKHNASKDGYRSSCKECAQIYKKQYRQENQEKIAFYMETYRKEHQDQISAQTKIYYENNKEDILEYRKEYKVEYNKQNKEAILKKQNEREAKRMKSDPVFKVRRRVSASIRAMLKTNDVAKNGKSILEFLPYTIDELKTHLEKQFEPWMTWENHGSYKTATWDDSDPATWTWQIDHIIPHSTFQYASMEDEAFKKCWALANLRPLSAKQNNLDGTTRIRHK